MVVIDNDASARATVVEVRAPDAVGVLHTITGALSDAGLDIRSARVSTLGHSVVDSFYVVDGSGKKIEDEATIRDVEERILRALDEQDQNVDESTRST